VATLIAAASLASCGDDPEQLPTPSPTQPEAKARDAPRPPPCPPDLRNCTRASGTIAYVERVDPDGDGDAHFVLLSADSVTAPGITILDVRRDLRPRPLPGPGEQLAGAGPVLPGSHGQLQIEAVEVRTAR
jgi:hypothetical protein